MCLAWIIEAEVGGIPKERVLMTLPGSSALSVGPLYGEGRKSIGG